MDKVTLMSTFQCETSKKKYNQPAVCSINEECTSVPCLAVVSIRTLEIWRLYGFGLRQTRSMGFEIFTKYHHSSY